MLFYNLKIYAPDKVFYDGDCEYLNVPTEIGMYGILANHRNTITAIVPGKLTFRMPGKENLEVAVSSGMMKIENSDVLLLVESCEWPEDIDVERARRAEEEARRLLKQKRSRIEYHLAQANLVRALNRLKIKSNKN